MASPVIRYHVFSSDAHGLPIDVWFTPRDWRQARRLYGQLARENECARLYEEVYPDQDAYEQDEGDEDCLYSYGHWPL